MSAFGIIQKQICCLCKKIQILDVSINNEVNISGDLTLGNVKLYDDFIVNETATFLSDVKIEKKLKVNTMTVTGANTLIVYENAILNDVNVSGETNINDLDVINRTEFNKPVIFKSGVIFNPLEIVAKEIITTGPNDILTGSNYSEVLGGMISNFGTQSVVSKDGNLLIVGSVNDSLIIDTGPQTGTSYPGAVYIYNKTGSVDNATWENISVLYPSNAEVCDSYTIKCASLFGSSVTISDDNNYIVVGAPFDSINDITGAGSVHIFKRTGTGYDNWNQVGILTGTTIYENLFFGSSITISNDNNLIAVSSRKQIGSTTVSGANGIVDIFINDSDNWNLNYTLTSGYSNVLGDGFGKSISFSNDTGPISGENNLYISDIIEFNNAISQVAPGYVNEYQYDGSDWTVTKQIFDPITSDVVSGGSANFGDNILFMNDNDYLLVNSGSKSSGIQKRVYQFKLNEVTKLWDLINTFTSTGSNSANGSDNFGSSSDNFRGSVNVSNGDDFIIVGAPNDNSNDGSVYLFQRVDDTYLHYSRSKIDNTGTNDSNSFFGSNVLMSGNTLTGGDMIISQSTNNVDTVGKVFVYKMNNIVKGDINTGETVSTNLSLNEFKTNYSAVENISVVNKIKNITGSCNIVLPTDEPNVNNAIISNTVVDDTVSFNYSDVISGDFTTGGTGPSGDIQRFLNVDINGVQYRLALYDANL